MPTSADGAIGVRLPARTRFGVYRPASAAAVKVVASGNTIDFLVGHGEAGPVKEMLTALVLGNHPAQCAPQQAAAQATEAAVPRQDPWPSITDELRQLADLRDAGVVTEAECNAKKAELLARL